MKRTVTPPWQVQQRAWECAYVLRDHYDTLPIENRVQVEVIYRTYPDGLGWLDIARMFVLYREVAGTRV